MKIRLKARSRTHSRTRRTRRLFVWAAGLLLLWLIVAYLALPRWWRHHEKLHPALVDAPTLTTTSAGIPADPLNLFIIATDAELTTALLENGWHPADPVTLQSSLRIAGDAVLGRPYDHAPVSPLILFGRHQDLAFEKPHGTSPRERHHVRFWRAPQTDTHGRIAWWGAATFDRSVGLSHDTGEITHHIAPEVDPERDLILTALKSAGFATITYRDDFQAPTGKNGGGDPWQTDRRLGIATHSNAEDK
ncbi:LssY C-terminal domain-containing protein [Luteolibacter arcticus]|uniref:LssY C-terminal domain-containing protein n=1 Tax=Luteolibacter arcticus TaxID=1581411 RepID=A0ABT3GT02_9BACT|nr:LssY C-terminal domain-containing protein [Luteolibacter arcticus]MCW1926656.1 LssY C-terminal domain-containing protein [Luteolibacter arcticus]